MLADFTITIHEARKPMAVQVKVHDSVAALRSAATKHALRMDRKDEYQDTVGVCHRFHMMGGPVVALVRLAPPHIGAGVVAHELTHAAVWLWEIQNKFDKKVPLMCDNDEWFAWVLGELMSKTVNKLIETGVYDREYAGRA